LCSVMCEAFLLLFLQPLETKLISDTSGLFEASHVARVILNDAVVSYQFLYSSVVIYMCRNAVMLMV